MAGKHTSYLHPPLPTAAAAAAVAAAAHVRPPQTRLGVLPVADHDAYSLANGC